MDRKSQKLTNILLFIIVCFFVLGALCGIGRMAFGHRGFEGKFKGCHTQGEYKNLDKESCAGFGAKDSSCPYAEQNLETTTTK